MTDDQARRAANIILALAGAGAAIYILKTPPLRRAAWRLAGTLVTGPLAAWFTSELQRAWSESAAAAPPEPQTPRDMMNV
jgi:hypothetical protein